MPSHEQRQLYAQGKKRCNKCKEIKPFSAYYKRVEGGVEYCFPRCIECNNAFYQENKDEIRELRRRTRLGVPLGTYELLVKKYGALCAICGDSNPGGTSKESGQFHIDHDHETGDVRGLLCGTCNVGIGMFRNSQALLLAAISYLRQKTISVSELESELGITPRVSSLDELM